MSATENLIPAVLHNADGQVQSHAHDQAHRAMNTEFEPEKLWL